jgi:hypothetical protein
MSHELPVEEMLSDVACMEELANRHAAPADDLARVLCCHVRALAQAVEVADEQVKVAASRAQGYRDALFRIACRCENWSDVDVRANVADALGLTLAELESQLTNPR